MRRTWRDLEKDHDVLAEKHDNHVAESERNSSELRKEMVSFHTELADEIRGLRSDIKPMMEVFTSTKLSGRALAKLVAFVGAIVAMVVSIKATFFR
jgi:hypothetical protein